MTRTPLTQTYSESHVTHGHRNADGETHNYVHDTFTWSQTPECTADRNIHDDTRAQCRHTRRTVDTHANVHTTPSHVVRPTRTCIACHLAHLKGRVLFTCGCVLVFEGCGPFDAGVTCLSALRRSCGPPVLRRRPHSCSDARARAPTHAHTDGRTDGQKDGFPRTHADGASGQLRFCCRVPERTSRPGGVAVAEVVALCATERLCACADRRRVRSCKEKSGSVRPLFQTARNATSTLCLRRNLMCLLNKSPPPPPPQKKDHTGIRSQIEHRHVLISCRPD